MHHVRSVLVDVSMRVAMCCDLDAAHAWCIQSTCYDHLAHGMLRRYNHRTYMLPQSQIYATQHALRLLARYHASCYKFVGIHSVMDQRHQHV
jgi:hypothetical protein